MPEDDIPPLSAEESRQFDEAGGNGNGTRPKPNGAAPSGPEPIELRVGETEKIVNEIERRLIASKRGLFQRGGVIVCTGFAEMPTWNKGKVITQIIAARGDYALTEDLEAVAGFLHFNKKGKLVACSPPMRLVYTLKDREHRLRFPVLTGIVNCPSISANGELLDQPGYDPKTGILFDPLGAVFPRVPDCPSKQQAEAALKRLLRLIETFDFVSDDDKAVALSLFLTIICRRGLPFVPLHGFDAPVAGSGKSKIVDIACILATGHEAGVVSLGKKQEEAEKRLSSMLMRGDQLIAIDNLDQPLEGALLNQALTQQQVELRILGFSKMVVARTSTSITATGNNLIVKGDMTRRAVVGRLDPKVERPELRSFDYDPLADAKENRGELVVAVLTILKAYHNAGRPNRPSPLQSFTHWSNTVRGALMWLGQGDPVGTMRRLRGADPTLINLRAVLTVWRDHFGADPITSAAVVAKAEETITFEKAVGSDEKIRRHAHPSLRDALLMVAGKSGRIDTRVLGIWLGKSADRVIDIGENDANDFVALEEGKLLRGNRQWHVIQKQMGI
jgi:putative DNA primase/helicase